MPPILRVVLAGLVLMAAIAGAVAVGVRWGAPPYVAVKAERGVLIVNRFTGQAWLVRADTRYPVEPEQAQAIRAEREAEVRRAADREADVNHVIDLLRQENQERRTGR